MRKIIFLSIFILLVSLSFTQAVSSTDAEHTRPRGLPFSQPYPGLDHFYGKPQPEWQSLESLPFLCPGEKPLEEMKKMCIGHGGTVLEKIEPAQNCPYIDCLFEDGINTRPWNTDPVPRVFP